MGGRVPNILVVVLNLKELTDTRTHFHLLYDLGPWRHVFEVMLNILREARLWTLTLHSLEATHRIVF